MPLRTITGLNLFWSCILQYLVCLKKINIKQSCNCSDYNIEIVVKPSISSHSKPHMRSSTRRTKCFVLEQSVFKTKKLRCLVWDLVRDFEWLKILGLRLAGQLRSASLSTADHFRIYKVDCRICGETTVINETQCIYNCNSYNQ